MSDPTPPTVSDAMREAVAPVTRAEVRACIGPTIPLRRRWVDLLMRGPIARLQAETARLMGERDEIREAFMRVAEAIGAPASERLDLEVRDRLRAAEAETARLRAENDRLSETYTDEDGTVWSPPTAWAYFAACRALNAKTAALAEARAEGRRQGLEEAAKLTEHWSLNRISREIRSLATAPAETQKPEETA